MLELGWDTEGVNRNSTDGQKNVSYLTLLRTVSLVELGWANDGVYRIHEMERSTSTT